MHLAHKIFFSLWICAAAVSKEINEPNSEIVKQDDTCGGFVELRRDEMVVIEYKPEEEYDNDEFCVWGVSNLNSHKFLISKITSGFEIGYDYLLISPFTIYSSAPSKHYIMGNTTGIEQINFIEASFIFVVFSTDYSNTGTGFRLEIAGYYDGGGKDCNEDLFTTSPFGSATYRPYQSWQSRSYLIVPTLKSVGSLVLDLEYVIERYDYLSVYSMERNGQSTHFRQHADRLTGNGTASFRTDYYANFLVIFDSDFGEGGGYELKWYVPDSPTTEIYV